MATVYLAVVWRTSYLFSQGRFTIAAKHHISIAEIYESDLVDIDKVSEIYTLLWKLLLVI